MKDLVLKIELNYVKKIKLKNSIQHQN